MIEVIEYLFSFEGRINRKKFHIAEFSYMAFIILFNLILGSVNLHWMIDLSIGFFSWVSYMSFLVRRVHDLGRPGYVLFIPIYNMYIAVLVLFVRGDQGPNRYGEDPLQVVSVQKIV